MVDVLNQEQRRLNMSRIRGKDTKPEMLLRRSLHALGYRYQLHRPDLIGRPDLLFPMYKAVIFVHGCFWHGHDNCKYFVMPMTRTDWWSNKIERNKLLDRENILKLTSEGWQVYTVFECELKKEKINHTLSQLLTHLNNTLRTKVLKMDVKVIHGNLQG